MSGNRRVASCAERYRSRVARTFCAERSPTHARCDPSRGWWDVLQLTSSLRTKGKGTCWVYGLALSDGKRNEVCFQGLQTKNRVEVFPKVFGRVKPQTYRRLFGLSTSTVASSASRTTVDQQGYSIQFQSELAGIRTTSTNPATHLNAHFYFYFNPKKRGLRQP